MIEFKTIEIDTSQPRWLLTGGVSDRGESAQGYDSTCEIEVAKRGKELADPFKDKK